MKDLKKQALLRKLGLRERILKGKLQFYVRYRSDIPEGITYADDQINKYLDELKDLWKLKKLLEE
ncbi:MAG TPA: hypothetical protein ENJ95_24675 [Bacteroidetes bacterium]|nr:hypothetical protein [Bacteroidota bacterium]